MPAGGALASLVRMAPSSPVGGFNARSSGNAALDKHCYRHPSVARETSCPQCTRSICRTCVVLTPEGNYCPSCAAERRASLSTARVNVILWTGLALGMAGVAISLVPPAQTAADRVAVHQAEMDAQEKASRTVNGRDYGVDTYQAVTMQKRLRDGSCEMEVVRALADTQLRHKDEDGALATLLEFEGRCGGEPRLLDLKAAAREGVGDLSGALRDARVLAEVYPNAQQHYRVGRLLLKTQEDGAQAMVELSRGIALHPTGTTLLVSLAEAQQRVGDPCGAAYTLHRLERTQPRGDTRALNAQAGASGCDTPRAAGAITVQPQRGDPTVFKLTVGGKSTTADVDPTMAFLTLTNMDARRLGLQGVDAAPVVSIMLAGSVVTAHVVRVEQLVLSASRGGKGTITARDVDVAVVDVPDDEAFAPKMGHNVLDLLETTGDDAAVTWRAWAPAPHVDPLPG